MWSIGNCEITKIKLPVASHGRGEASINRSSETWRTPCRKHKVDEPIVWAPSLQRANTNRSWGAQENLTNTGRLKLGEPTQYAIGEVEWRKPKQEVCNQQRALVQLAGYAQEVFGTQATQRFVLFPSLFPITHVPFTNANNNRFVYAFTICGSLVRCYLFDHAGVSISPDFIITEIDKSQKHVVYILLFFAGMSFQPLRSNSNSTQRPPHAARSRPPATTQLHPQVVGFGNPQSIRLGIASILCWRNAHAG